MIIVDRLKADGHTIDDRFQNLEKTAGEPAQPQPSGSPQDNTGKRTLEDEDDDDHCEQFLQAAAAEALRCDPKYLGTAVRLSKSGKNASISDEPKSGEITGAAADVFTVLVEGAKKTNQFTRAEP